MPGTTPIEAVTVAEAVMGEAVAAETVTAGAGGGWSGDGRWGGNGRGGCIRTGVNVAERGFWIVILP